MDVVAHAFRVHNLLLPGSPYSSAWRILLPFSLDYAYGSKFLRDVYPYFECYDHLKILQQVIEPVEKPFYFCSFDYNRYALHLRQVAFIVHNERRVVATLCMIGYQLPNELIARVLTYDHGIFTTALHVAECPFLREERLINAYLHNKRL